MILCSENPADGSSYFAITGLLHQLSSGFADTFVLESMNVIEEKENPAPSAHLHAHDEAGSLLVAEEAGEAVWPIIHSELAAPHSTTLK